MRIKGMIWHHALVDAAVNKTGAHIPLEFGGASNLMCKHEEQVFYIPRRSKYIRVYKKHSTGNPSI